MCNYDESSLLLACTRHFKSWTKKLVTFSLRDSGKDERYDHNKLIIAVLTAAHNNVRNIYSFSRYMKSNVSLGPYSHGPI